MMIAEMLKSYGVEGPRQVRDLIQDIHFGKSPSEWEESIIVSLIDKAMPLSEEIIEASNC